MDLSKYYARHYHEILDELEKLANKRNMKFQKSDPSGGERDRVYFKLIDGESISLKGFVTMPTREREWEDRAFNRIWERDRYNLKEYERKGIRCLVLQCWGEPYPVVVIPVKELEKRSVFRKDGRFTIKKENDGYHLMGERNIRFKKILDKEGLDKVFDYLRD